MPAELNLFQLSAKVLDEISIYLNKAVVFLDDASAEVMHWHGAATMLFNCGASDVREFSSFEVMHCFFVSFLIRVKLTGSVNYKVCLLVRRVNTIASGNSYFSRCMSIFIAALVRIEHRLANNLMCSETKY